VINKKSSLANKILMVTAVIFIALNIFLIYGATMLNKNTIYEMEQEKAKLIASNYAPFISVHLFLKMKNKLEKISKQILENKNVEKVVISSYGKTVVTNEKEHMPHSISIKTTIPLYLPNSEMIIGYLDIYYASNKFQSFVNKYFVFSLISFIITFFMFLWLNIYIKNLLYPLKNLSKLLQNFDPEVKLQIPYTDRKDEIGLISSAIDISNSKTVEYSKNLQELANILLDTNQNLEQRIKDELQIIREKDKQLFHQSRLAQMGEMINMIAHQWRQPLSAISATTSNLSFKLMFEEKLDKEELEKEIYLISQYSQHLSRTIDDFRNFFKDNKEKQESKLHSLIEETLHIARVSIENHNIELKTNFMCNATINTYPNEVKQVLLNLLKNAQDALIEKNITDPYIEIGTYCKKDNKSYIYVKDNAGGIPEDIIENIFEPYFSTKLEKDGTGLGLYMSKIIIEDHCKGKLYVKNEKKGAKFIIKFDTSDDIQM